MADVASKSSHRTFEFGFLLAVITVAIWIVKDGRWEASLFDGNQTMLIDLGIRPAWSPPTAPSLKEFEEHFAGSIGPPIQKANAQISVGLKWDWMLIDFALLVWGITVLFAMLSFTSPLVQQSLAGYVARWLALSFTVAAAGCFALWIVFGGWGPPEPLFFACVGVVFGAWLGISRWGKHRSA